MIPVEEDSTPQLKPLPGSKGAEIVKNPVSPITTGLDIKGEVNNMPTACKRLKKTSDKTAIQLVDGNGNVESYLDTDDDGILLFREGADMDLCQISDERTGKALVYISGYALQFTFNMAELNSMERVEQCLQGLTKLFRHKIIAQMNNNR